MKQLSICKNMMAFLNWAIPYSYYKIISHYVDIFHVSFTTIKDRQLLIRGVCVWFHQFGTGSLFLNSLSLLC